MELNFEKLDALRGIFPPFWVNFVGKTLRSDKKAI
jgi:hypothetical protein